MNKLLQRLTVVSIMTIAVPFSLVWAKNNSSHFHACAGTGTYQLITEKDPSTSYTGNFMDSLRVVIQAKRDKVKEVVLQISPETSVRILPEREISNSHFIPVDEFVFVDRSVKHLSK